HDADQRHEHQRGEREPRTQSGPHQWPAPLNTRFDKSSKRPASAAPVGRLPYHAASKSSVAPPKSAAATGMARATSTRYSPVERPGISSMRPRDARSATRAR